MKKASKIIQRISQFLKPTKNLFKNDIVVIASAHKVGSTWLFDLITDLGSYQKASPPKQFRETGTLVLDDDALLYYMRFIRGKKIFKSHSYPPSFIFDDSVKIISIFRDPRDIVISSIFYLANLRPELGGWGETFRLMSEKERIIHFIKKGEFCLSRLEKWWDYDRALNVKYEGLLKNTYDELIIIKNWLHIQIEDGRIQKAIDDNSFQKKTNRKPGHENKNSFFRKGVSGDWRNYFDSECVEFFRNEKQGRWNSILIKMGYENQPNWSL